MLSFVIEYLLCFFLVESLLFWGGGWGEEIEIKVYLSPAEAEILVELGNITNNVTAQMKINMIHINFNNR